MTNKEIKAQIEDLKQWLSKGGRYKVRMNCDTQKELDKLKTAYMKAMDYDMFERIEWRVCKK